MVTVCTRSRIIFFLSALSITEGVFLLEDQSFNLRTFYKYFFHLFSNARFGKGGDIIRQGCAPRSISLMYYYILSESDTKLAKTKSPVDHGLLWIKLKSKFQFLKLC